MLTFLLTCLCFHRIFAVDLSACYPNPPKIIDAIFKMSDDIYSPGYQTNLYPNDVYCSYTIRAPSIYKIKITFKDFDIDPFDLCMKDSLAIHEGTNPQGPVIGVFCGNNTPNAIVSQTNALHLVFQSDFLTGRKGFHITYEVSLGHDLCPLGQVRCKNRNCYKIGSKCNGDDDCGDGTDEENCRKPLPVTKCGTPAITPLSSNEGWDRVVGGKAALPGSWPWQADLQLSYYEPNGHMCGGTLLNAQWVVTAAHCVQQNYHPEEWRIHLGNYKKFSKDSEEQVRYAERLIVYPGITGIQLQGQLDMENDIALVKLNAPVKFTDHVSPACLPTQGQEIIVKTVCMATGWGTTRGTGSSEVLKQVDLTIRAQTECSVNFPFNNKTMICVKNDKGEQDVCHGDSGGPLVCKYNNQWYVMGATSFGTDTNFESGLCALPDAYTVYTKISSKIQWINSMINMYS